MSMRRISTVIVVGVLAGSACGKHEFEPPSQEGRVEDAEARYSSELFDTVTWASDSVRALDGNIVYAAKCRDCHGTMGKGGTDYARERGLDAPSLVEPDWPYAASLDSVRHRVFVGHTEGMPTWGVAGITPREIDGASYYILEVLRPDVLGGS